MGLAEYKKRHAKGLLKPVPNWFEKRPPMFCSSYGEIEVLLNPPKCVLGGNISIDGPQIYSHAIVLYKSILFVSGLQAAKNNLLFLPMYTPVILRLEYLKRGKASIL